jgi:outer membrane protein assembly factor BamB
MTDRALTTTMTRALKIALIGGLAVTAASCAAQREMLPFGLGGKKENTAVATAGQRVSVLEFEQQLAPSAALSGRDFFLPGPQAATSWPLPGGTPENSVEHVIAAADFTVAWKRDIGAGSGKTRQIMAPVVADGGKVFVLDGESTVTAVDAASGEILWKHNVKPEGRERGDGILGFNIRPGSSSLTGGFGGGVAVAGGKVFVSSGYRTMSALDAATGAVVWTVPVDSPIHGAPTVSGPRVYVVDVDNQIIAFNTANGQQDWSYRGIAEPARIMRASSPAVVGDTAGRPVVSRGFVYAVSHSGVMQAMDIRSGQAKWTLPVAGVNAPLPAGDVIYVVSKAGELTLINRDSGAVYWTKDLNVGRIRKEGGVFGLWDHTVRPEWSGPILASNRLILVNSDGDAVAFDPKTGVQTASIKLGAAAYVAPAAYNGALYVLNDKGQLVCIR